MPMTLQGMLQGKSALITGSTDGLGFAIARGLAAEGCNVVINGLADPGHAEERRRELETAFGVRALYDAADLRKPDAIAAMAHTAVDAFGSVDILVNNAVVRHFAPVEAFPAERWEEALAVNLTAPFHLIRLLLPQMRTRGYGRIVNISSIYGLIGATGRVDYVTTKTGLIGMTRAVAAETVTENITCNALCPATVPTPAIEARIVAMTKKDGISHEEATRRYMEQRQPSRRFIAPETVAGQIVFLCSEAGLGITGAVLPLDGGWSAQ
jgi:3-hydroxybutyrate dehydrogenase